MGEKRTQNGLEMIDYPGYMPDKKAELCVQIANEVLDHPGSGLDGWMDGWMEDGEPRGASGEEGGLRCKK